MSNSVSERNFFTFRLRYFLFAILLFVVEVLIALYVRDRFVRPYFGDFLVVILLYCAIKSVINTSNLKTGVAVLLFAYLIETLQYFRFVDRMGLADNTLARVVIGYGFEWWDMLAYTLGIGVVVIVDRKENKIVL